MVAALIGAFAASVVAGVGPLGDAVREITLPLKSRGHHPPAGGREDLDPALVAAVIYEESKFRDQTSHAGARGLMQITPATARLHRPRLGRHRVHPGDLATPQVNISYGAYYLRYLLDRYDGDPSSRSRPTTPARPT